MVPGACQHEEVYHDTCDGARENTSWIRPDEQARLAAVTVDGLTPSTQDLDRPKPMSFPGPLVLPDDALAIDPEHEPQPMHEYVNADYRNHVTPQRKTLYIFDVPTFAPEVAYMESWIEPVVPAGDENKPPPQTLGAQRPSVWNIAAYIEAFYHGTRVRVIQNRFRFVKWTSQKRRAGAATAKYIGLEAAASFGVPASVTQIRCRPSSDGVAAGGQLNLDDLLDGLREALPSDAYAAMLLMHHDMYEGEDDLFCCGRAYGASRISVMSTFRDHPKLRRSDGITEQHTWPNSHCRAYIDDLWACATENDQSGGSTQRRPFDKAQMEYVSEPQYKRMVKGGRKPMEEAIQKTRTYANTPSRFKRKDWEETWLAGACVVAVHELGHCFGLDHCVYYACVMQGTASVAEDTQQPPYLCPVCQAKVAFTTAIEPAHSQDWRHKNHEEVDRLGRKWTLEQYAALKKYCTARKGGVMFNGFAAWLQERIEETEVFEDSQTREASYEASLAETSDASVSRSASHFSAMVEEVAQ